MKLAPVTCIQVEDPGPDRKGDREEEREATKVIAPCATRKGAHSELQLKFGNGFPWLSRRQSIIFVQTHPPRCPRAQYAVNLN